jgi:hypothetical protein
MQKFIFFLFFVILFFTSGARAEDLYLNCKFENGSIIIKSKEYRINKGEKGTEDINIILNINRKKIIEAPGYYKEQNEDKKYNIYGHERTQSSTWSDNEIKWSFTGDTPSTGAKMSGYYNLNRRSGVLNYTQHLDFPNDKSKMDRQHNCTKQDKKF